MSQISVCCCSRFDTASILLQATEVGQFIHGSVGAMMPYVYIPCCAGLDSHRQLQPLL